MTPYWQDALEFDVEARTLVRTDRLGPDEYGASSVVARDVDWSFGLWAEATWRAAAPASPVRLPEPDMWLIGGILGREFSDQEKAEWHDQWHLDNPRHSCERPDQPRSSHRPGRWERLRRWMA